MDLVSRYKVRDLPYEVRVVSEPDKGIYDAMNKGLRLATGEYIVFLNAGDTLHDEKTLDMVASSLQPAANSQQPAVIYGDTNIVDDEGHFLRKRHLSVPDNLTWRSFKQGMLVCHQAFYARLDIAREIPYDLQYRHSADVDWCIRVMKEAERRHLPLVRVQGVVADFLDGGDSSKNHRASLRERFHVMRRHYGLLTTCLMHVWFLLRSVFR
jgi:glycosyltransferase involved in cell wall biosynthesis